MHCIHQNKFTFDKSVTSGHFNKNVQPIIFDLKKLNFFGKARD